MTEKGHSYPVKSGNYGLCCSQGLAEEQTSKLAIKGSLSRVCVVLRMRKRSGEHYRRLRMPAENFGNVVEG